MSEQLGTQQNCSKIATTEVTYTPPGSTPPTLSNISLAIRAGEVTVVVGPNGAGKSTLLRLMAGLSEPVEGSVVYNGRPYPKDDRTRARLFHLVSSEHNPSFDFTVEQAVAMGRYPHRGRAVGRKLPETSRAVIDRAIARTDTQHLAQRSVLNLSSGELRRVWIARALVSEAQFLLLDEPTANLDLAHARSVLELARSLADEGHGVVMALHDLQGALDVADQVVLLHQGELKAVGPPQHVLSAKNVAEVFGVRFCVEAPEDPDSIPRLTTLNAP